MPVTVRSFTRFCAIAALLAIAGCATKPLPPAPKPAPPPIPEPQAGRFIDLIHKHVQLPAAADAGRSVGLRRRRSTAGATGAGR